METLALLGQWQPLAIGQVELWGRVLVRDGIYRAEFAKVAGYPTSVTRVTVVPHDDSDAGDGGGDFVRVVIRQRIK